MEAPRPLPQRKADTLAKLESRHDLWVASASASGVPHLVPLSCAWDGTCLIVAVERSSVTARNILASGRCRLAFGPTRDVVMIDAALDGAHDVDDALSLAETYVQQADWDPREAGDGFCFLALRPVRIQAWREVNEIADRTLMREGQWLA